MQLIIKPSDFNHLINLKSVILMVNKIYRTGRFLLLSGFFCLFSCGLHAQITVRLTNQTIKRVIEAIEKSEGYSFSIPTSFRVWIRLSVSRSPTSL